jgi:hypothetical protein
MVPRAGGYNTFGVQKGRPDIGSHTMTPHRVRRCFVAVALTLLATLPARPADPPALKTEQFDRDPGWDGFNNRLAPKNAPTITQAFGYSRTRFATDTPGEIGGQVWRSNTVAFYGRPIAPKTLADPLTATGTFALTKSAGSSGMFFGWFNAVQPGSGRPTNSLGFYIDGEGSGGRLAVHLISGHNRVCGTFVTPFTPGGYRPTPVKNDGTRYHWSLSYDPAGRGRVRFTIRSDAATHEPWEGKEVAFDVPEPVRTDGATFDRFGLMNVQRAGNPLSIFVGGLTVDGTPVDLSNDPGWDGHGNRVTYQDREQNGANDFGYSPTSHAGGKPGEIGGLLWRMDKLLGYYADRVGPLTFADRLEARGKVVLVVGAPDSDAAFGWFGSESKDQYPTTAGPFVGVKIGGPTRVGHYFAPGYVTGRGTKGSPKTAPVLVPGKVHAWTLVYDPAAAGGRGSLRLTLDGQSAAVELTAGAKAEGGRLDRFGLLTVGPGGGSLKVYFDDLTYTAGSGAK